MRLTRLPWLWAAGLMLCLSACSGIPVADYDTADTLPDRMELVRVPFYAQEAYQCGPAALAMVLSAAGAPHLPNELTDQVYLPQRQGSLQPELLAATRRAGLLPYVLEPGPHTLLSEVAAGHPVLVLQNLGFALAPRWHYAVVVGYDRPKQEVTLRSGNQRRQTMDIQDFDRSWAKAGRWAFVAMAPDHLPANATEERFVATALTLEGVAPDAAARAYGAAIERWPGNLLARIGVGNAAYRRHDLAAAAVAYRQATVDHPAAADAWNNLAQVLHESHRHPEAMTAARRAVEIGGPRRPTYEATLATVEGGPAP